jgi:peroxiredoxin
MLVDNGEVVKVFEEPGKNNAGDNGDPFEVSDADTMIKYLRENAG